MTTAQMAAALVAIAFLIGAVAGYVGREWYARHREARRVEHLRLYVADVLANMQAWQASNCQCEECAAKRREREACVS